MALWIIDPISFGVVAALLLIWGFFRRGTVARRGCLLFGLYGDKFNSGASCGVRWLKVAVPRRGMRRWGMVRRRVYVFRSCETRQRERRDALVNLEWFRCLIFRVWREMLLGMVLRIAEAVQNHEDRQTVEQTSVTQGNSILGYRKMVVFN